MECVCDIKVSRSSHSIYRSGKLTLQETEESTILLCTMKNSLVPLRINVKNAVKKVLDAQSNTTGTVHIVLSESATNGISELYIRNADDPYRLNQIMTKVKDKLPKPIVRSTNPRKSQYSRGNRMLEASKARSKGLIIPDSTKGLIPQSKGLIQESPKGLLSESSRFYSSSTSSQSLTPSRPLQTSGCRRPLLECNTTLFTSDSKRPKLDFTVPKFEISKFDDRLDTPSPPGFVNLGNSCYMNAVLQSLLALKCFINDLKALSNGVAPNSLTQQLLLLTDSSPDRALLSRIRAMLCRRGKHLSIFNEQDAQEVLLLFLDTIRNELSNIEFKDSKCPVSRNFELIIEQRLTCTECRNVKTSSDGVTDLTLHINDHCNLQEILHDYFKEETVEYKCGLCPCKSAILTRTIITLPRVLISTLKRYSHTSSAMTGKNTQSVVISPSINLEKLYTSAVKMVSSYSLCCVISHLGKASDYGHYIADILYKETEQWLTYSDDIVRRTALQEIIEKRRCSGYLLFYVRQDCI